MINFGGITNNTTELSSKDGDMEVLNNVRHNGGVIKPVPISEEITFVDSEGNIIEDIPHILFIHEFNDISNWISYKDNNIYYFGTNKNINTVIVSESVIYSGINIENIISIKAIGGIMVISTIEKIIYLYYDATLNSKYRNTDLSLLYNSRIYTGRSSTNYNEVFYDDDTSARDIMYEQIFRGQTGETPPYVLQKLEELRKASKFYNPVFVRYAWKLYDGTYTHHSEPILIVPRNFKAQYSPVEGSGSATENIDIFRPTIFLSEYAQNTVYPRLAIPSFGLSTTVNKIDLSSLEDIVESLDIFISVVEQFDSTDTMNVVWEVGNGATVPVTTILDTREVISANLGSKADLFGTEILKQNIEELSVFRKVKSIPLSEINSESGGQYFWDFDLSEDDLWNNIEQQDTLPDDEFSHNEEVGGLFVYNSMMHIYNISLYPYSGYPIYAYVNNGQNNSPLYNWIDTSAYENVRVLEMYVDTYLNIDGKNIIVRVLEKSFPNNTIYMGLGRYISYPDSRAYKMVSGVILYDNITSGKYESVITVDLKESSFLNNSFYTNNITTTTTTFPYMLRDESYDRDPRINNYLMMIEHPTTLRFVSSDYTYNDIEKVKTFDTNKIKVSATNNPIYYPIERTYTIGSGTIKGLGVSNIALSEGQFGQYPLYVFCSDGIYALSVGDGEVAYGVSSPIARDSVIGDFISIDKGIVFISDKSIKVIQGDTVVDISTPLTKDSVFSNSTNENKYYDCSFEDYIVNAKLAFNYTEKEILVYRGDKNYYYVYGLETQIWSTRTQPLMQTIDLYPNIIGNIDNKFNILNKEISIDSDTMICVALRTRAMNFGSVGFKSLKKGILRGFYKGSFVAKLEVSNDAYNWIESSNTKFDVPNGVRDIKIPRVGASYIYYRVSIYGKISLSSYISFLEIDAEQKFSNKLR